MNLSSDCASKTDVLRAYFAKAANGRSGWFPLFSYLPWTYGFASAVVKA